MIFELHPQLAADTLLLGHFKLSDVLLMNDSQYPWVVLVPRRAEAREIYQLASEDRRQLMLESEAVSESMMQHFNGDKFNLAALGNLVPQLHLHHVVRKQNDAAWPQAVWGAAPRVEYSQEELSTLVPSLQAEFSRLSVEFDEC